MTQALRDAAQALLDVCNGYGCTRETEIEARKDALRAALSAPQPTADERVAEHMRLVATVAGRAYERDYVALAVATAAVEQSARALLSASQDDAEHAAMYRWLRDDWDGLPLAGGRNGFDAAIRSAMNAKEAK